MKKSLLALPLIALCACGEEKENVRVKHPHQQLK